MHRMHNYKELDMNVSDLPFMNFFTSRYSISFRIPAQKTYDYTKANIMSFYVLSLGCLLKGLNAVPELRRRIIDNKVVEYEQIDGITPLMGDDQLNREMRVSLPGKSETLRQWHDKIVNQQEAILKNKEPAFSIDLQKRDTAPIANFSCLPWIDFDTLTNCIAQPNTIQPLITWGKLTDGKMSVSIAVSHVFVDGYRLKLFKDAIEYCFEDPERIVE